jgi:serine/threonine-protein kinase
MTDAVQRLTAALADRYTIERELGAGGMATVYLAHDVKHDRKVALKVLRPELSAILGAERFLHEIKTTANLQHPHILPLHDSGEAGGLVYYVMPYVEGESLRDRLTREQQLPVEDAVRIACEVADALDYAHRHGVIHRDIKPENILLHDGRAQVADFGIALAVSTAGAGTRMTETGMSLGTPHYMSPEQAMGQREITAKSDVYALGCVLYEMLSGEPPFNGPNAQAIIARVMTESPRSLTLQRKSVPPHVEAAVTAALEKLPADRIATAALFAEALKGGGPGDRGTGVPRMAGSSRPAVPRSRGLAFVAFVAVVVVAVGAAGAAFWVWRHPRPSAETPRFSIVLPDSEGVRTDHPNRSLAFAPDGSRFVYVGSGPRRRRMLYERSVGQLDPRLIPGTEGVDGPFFSADGQWVAFFADGKLKKVALAGGPPLTLADAPNPRGGAWSENGVIVFAGAATTGLVRVSAAGGPVDTLSRVGADTSTGTSHRLPQFLPGGGTVIFTELVGAGVRVAALDLASRRITTLVDQAMDARYARTGHLVYGTQTGALVAVPFDARRVRVTGSPVSLLEGLLVKPTTGSAEFALSQTGRLVYLAGVETPRTLVLVDERGTERPLGSMLNLGSPRFSPDGRRIALVSSEGRNQDVRVLDLERGTLSRLTFEGVNNYPEWTADGRRVAFNSNRPGSRGLDIYWTAADGSGEARPLLTAPGVQQEVQFTPDGRTIALRQATPGTTTKRDLWIAQVDSPQAAHPYLASPFEERSMALSPDGAWMAYVSDESGRDEVYVRSFPEASGRWQISVDGGLEPRWAHSGRALFYRTGDSLVSVAVTTRPAFVQGQRSLVFMRPYFTGDTHHAHWDVAPGDRAFVFIRQGIETPSLVVALNWFEELKRRSAGGPVAASP